MGMEELGGRPGLRMDWGGVRGEEILQKVLWLKILKRSSPNPGMVTQREKLGSGPYHPQFRAVAG